MLTARVNNRSILEHLTQSINVIDALEESENAPWKEIVLLGFSYDRSDLSKFETLCHLTGKHVLAGPRKSYNVEAGADNTRIIFVATHDGDCRITQVELQMISGEASEPRKLGITLFTFSSTLNVSKIRNDEERVAHVLQKLYQRHQQSPVAVYFIGRARPQHFNIPLLFSEMDKLTFPAALAKIPPSSTTLIANLLDECKVAVAPANQSKLEAVHQHDEESESKQVVSTKHKHYHRSYVQSRPHRFPRGPLKSAVNRHKEIDKQSPHQPAKRNP